MVFIMKDERAEGSIKFLRLFLSEEEEQGDDDDAVNERLKSKQRVSVLR